LAKKKTANINISIAQKTDFSPTGPPPLPKKIFGPKMGKIGQKIAFFGNILTNPPDFHKSAVKFHEIF
jgi:hypothetical protein